MSERTTPNIYSKKIIRNFLLNRIKYFGFEYTNRRTINVFVNIIEKYTENLIKNAQRLSLHADRLYLTHYDIFTYLQLKNFDLNGVVRYVKKLPKTQFDQVENVPFPVQIEPENIKSNPNLSLLTLSPNSIKKFFDIDDDDIFENVDNVLKSPTNFKQYNTTQNVNDVYTIATDSHIVDFNKDQELYQKLSKGALKNVNILSSSIIDEDGKNLGYRFCLNMTSSSPNIPNKFKSIKISNVKKDVVEIVPKEDIFSKIPIFKEQVVNFDIPIVPDVKSNDVKVEENVIERIPLPKLKIKISLPVKNIGTENEISKKRKKPLVIESVDVKPVVNLNYIPKLTIKPPPIKKLKISFKKPKSPRIKEQDTVIVYICPCCLKEDDGSPMIACDRCFEWYHWACVGIFSEPPNDEKWFYETNLSVNLNKLEKIPESWDTLAKLDGCFNPFHVKMDMRKWGTFENPTVITSIYNQRLIGCACEENSKDIKWMFIQNGLPKQCQCDHWFKLVKILDEKKDFQRITKRKNEIKLLRRKI
ncbi:hypothetical protein A3Q56_03874 [Intoshia linei]|uniref:PHD-type domain-containing protein n=1 Tax=Intoshia linei TaxID=1819745 RepID=A0A177B4L7_9BILA|nr:hypothetical protein A3Q56_03874 [Intoshia linei]